MFTAVYRFNPRSLALTRLITTSLEKEKKKRVNNFAILVRNSTITIYFKSQLTQNILFSILQKRERQREMGTVMYTKKYAVYSSAFLSYNPQLFGHEKYNHKNLFGTSKEGKKKRD